MKRVLSVFMALFMAAALFAGCIKKNDAEEPTGTADSDVTYADLGESIVAKAGNYEFTKEDIDVYIDLIVPYIQQSTGSAPGWEEIVNSSGKTARDELISGAIEEARYQAAFVDYAKSEGFYTDADAKAYIDEYVANLGGEEEFDTFISETGLNKDSVFKYITYVGAYNAFMDYNCPDEKAEETYNKTFITAKHILITFNGRDSEDAALAEATEIYNKAANGADFEELINAHNEDPGQNAETGYTFKEGDMVTEFYQGALALNEGEISEPVKTTYGYHIIKRYPNPGSESENYSTYIDQVKQLKANETLSDEMYNNIVKKYPLVINKNILSTIDLSRYTVEQSSDVNYVDASVFD